MRTFIKIGSVFALAAIVLIITAAIFAKTVITPERIREAVQPAASKALNRDVQLGDISISIFSGITLHDLHIKKQNSDETFISATQASLRYQLLPLLSLRVVIDEILLEEPHINIVRLPDGSFNFSDLINADKTSATEENSASAKPASSEQSAAAPISLTVAAVSMSKGTILFTDEAVDPETPARYQISRINGRARDIKLDDSFPFEFSCHINEASLSLDGRADIINSSGSVQIEVDTLDAMPFLPLFADQIPGDLNRLTVDLKARITGDASQTSAEGTLTLRDIDLTLDGMNNAPFNNAQLQIDFNLNTDLQASLLHINSSRINFNGIIAEGSGSIEQLETNPLLKLDINLPDIDIPTAIGALPEKLVTDILSLNPTGKLNVQMRLEGHANGADVLKSAKLQLHNVQATAGSLRPSLNGKLLLTGKQLSSQELFIKSSGGLMNIDLSSQDLFATPIKLSNTINADELDLDKLLKDSPGSGAGSPDKKTSSEHSVSNSAAQEIGPFDLPVEAKGSVKIKQLIYKGLPINDFNLVYRLVDNILTIDEMTGQTAEGSFRQTGRIDLGVKGLAYQSSFSLQNLQTDPLISAFIPQAAQTIFGNLSLELNASGKGTLPETLKQNLTCLTKINLDNGRISGAKLSKSLAEFLNINELRDLHFNNYNGTIDIKQGRALVDTKLDGTDIRMSQKGTVGLNGILDLSLATSLGPELLKKLDKRGNVATYLTNKDGWAQLPLTLGGTLTQPRFSIHSTELLKQTEKTVVETLQGKLLEKIQEKQLDDSDNMTEEEKQAKKERKKARKKARKERKAAKKRALEN